MHSWRVARLTRLGIPGRWPRSTPTLLGFSIGRYPNRKLLIKPSQAAIKRVRERLASDLRALRDGNAMTVIATLNPLTRLGGLLLGCGVIQSVRLPGSLPVAHHLQVGHIAPQQRACLLYTSDAADE